MIRTCCRKTLQVRESLSLFVQLFIVSILFYSLILFCPCKRKTAWDLHFSETVLGFSLLLAAFTVTPLAEPLLLHTQTSDFISESWVFCPVTQTQADLSRLNENLLLPHRENSNHNITSDRSTIQPPHGSTMSTSACNINTHSHTHSHVRRPGGPAVPEAEVQQTGSSSDCWAPLLLTER